MTTTLIVVAALAALAAMSVPIYIAHRRQLQALRRFNSLVNVGGDFQRGLKGSDHD